MEIITTSLKIMNSVKDSRDKKNLSNIHTALENLFNKTKSAIPFQVTYTSCYELCMRKKSAELYDMLISLIKGRHDKEMDILDSDEFSSLDLYAKEFVNYWKYFKLYTYLLNTLIIYLDRTYINSVINDCFNNVQITIFTTKFLSIEKINNQVKDYLIVTITNRRNGEVTDTDKIKTLSQMYVTCDKSLELYSKYIELCITTNTEEYYSAESLSMITENNCQTYLNYVVKRMGEETELVNLLHPSTRDGHLNLLYDIFIKRNLSSLVQDTNYGVVSLIATDDNLSITILYEYVMKVDAIDLLIHVVSETIVEVGSKIAESSSKTKIDDLIQMYLKWQNLVKACFDNNGKLSNHTAKSFSCFINKTNIYAEELVMYIDSYLRNKKIDDKTLLETIDNAIEILQFVRDKDVFENLYRFKMKSRLLNNTMTSIEIEKHVIKQLKAAYGFSFTHKMETMIKDLMISKDMQVDYSNSTSDTILIPHVLQSGVWVFKNQLQTLNIPPSITAEIDKFTTYYKTKHGGKKLTWVYNSGTVNMKMTHESIKYELTVTPLQMLILLLFNDEETLTYNQILSYTGIEKYICVVHLLSLCTPRAPILKKSVKGQTIGISDKFTINQKFKSKTLRVKVPMIKMKARDKKEMSKMNNTIIKQREYVIKASIVRVMKSRGTLEFNDLTIETTKQLISRFHPEIRIIKKCVEDLINSEYLERNSDNPRSLTYLA